MTGHRTRLSIGLAVFVLLALALVQIAQPVQAAPTAGSRVFVPIIGSNFSLTTTPEQPAVRFWAERYALDTGGCTTLHWKAAGAQQVYLDGTGMTATGTQQACPVADTQFYQLEVHYATGDPQTLDLVLTSGDPHLDAGAVIAQATVQAVSPVADVDPTQDGNQAGYAVQLTNVAKLYAADATWSQAAVTLAVPQSAIDLGFSMLVHWPVKSGQLVEFRANCDGAACAVVESQASYLYLRSE